MVKDCSSSNVGQINFPEFPVCGDIWHIKNLHTCQIATIYDLYSQSVSLSEWWIFEYNVYNLVNKSHTLKWKCQHRDEISLLVTVIDAAIDDNFAKMTFRFDVGNGHYATFLIGGDIYVYIYIYIVYKSCSLDDYTNRPQCELFLYFHCKRINPKLIQIKHSFTFTY